MKNFKMPWTSVVLLKVESEQFPKDMGMAGVEGALIKVWADISGHNWFVW